ncbi:phosphatase PAP2 family protein [Bacillus dakarensis]|uniref:phosphatase PAP2 family protein n=1 Tax=Robertmurraya dakarensis TaxID=1926278 RepID=UPI00098196AD|nr:phosphatase PAP2 family protein [Bacillus dakarensis]
MVFGRSRIAIISAAVSLLISILIINAVIDGSIERLDAWGSAVAAKIVPDGAAPFFEMISGFGSTMGIGVIGILFLAVLWWKKRDYLGMAVFVFAVAIGNEVNKWIKEMAGRPRPVTAPSTDLHSLSFPSGHAMVGLTVYMLIAYFLIKDSKVKSLKWLVGILAGLLILLVGISRNVLGAHYPSDVWGGFFLGYVWTYLFITLYEVVNKKLKRKPV